MPRIKNRNFETYNDGILTICKTERGREIVKDRYSGIRFGIRTVGIKRFYEAKVNSNEIDKLVSIQRLPDIDRKDIILIDDEQYRIEQIQEKRDVKPPSLYLSLEKVVTLYSDRREKNVNS